MAQSYTYTRPRQKSQPSVHAQSTSKIAEVGTEDRLVHNFELSKDFGYVTFQMHWTPVFMPNHPTKVTWMTSIMEPSLIEPTSVTKCPKEVHQSQHNHGRMDQINHGKVIGNIVAGDIRKTCGTHQSTTNKEWPPWIIHRRQMDTTDTSGQHHDAHHIYSKQFVSFFCSCESVIFQHEQTCRRIFRCICERETKASSLRSNNCEDIERQECRHGLSRSTSTRLQSWRRLQA